MRGDDVVAATPRSRPILDVQGIGKSYRKTPVLVDFSLAIAPGEIHGLLGPNGSGKTTCLHVITGLIGADSGSVLIAGISVADKRSRHGFGFAPDDLPLPEALTGRELLAFHDALRGRDDRRRAAEFAGLLGLDDALDRPVAEYSHGMQRKIQLIAATMHDPDLLILDEPFRGLDPEAAATLRTLISAFAASGRAVLIATHDMLRAERDCDRVTILSTGRTVATGSPHRLISAHPGAATLENVFMSATGRAETATHRAAAMSVAFRQKESSR